MKFLTIGLLSFALSLNALAEESKICVITSDIDSEQTDMLIDVDAAGALDTIRLYKTMDKRVVSDESHPVERVMEEGIVASEREGRDIVILKTKNFNPETGGIVVMNFLYNAVSGNRRTYQMKLSKLNGKFVVSTMEGARINRLVFAGNRVLGQVVGIKEIRASLK
jgi:hypothetical protein